VVLGTCKLRAPAEVCSTPEEFFSIAKSVEFFMDLIPGPFCDVSREFEFMKQSFDDGEDPIFVVTINRIHNHILLERPLGLNRKSFGETDVDMHIVNLDKFIRKTKSNKGFRIGIHGLHYSVARLNHSCLSSHTQCYSLLMITKSAICNCYHTACSVKLECRISN
jgi:hypothetical protein